MITEEKIQQDPDDLRCTTCIHFGVCAEYMGGVNLSVVGAGCRHYKPSIDKAEMSCEGCCNIGFRYPFASMYPCSSCIRANQKDYYNYPIKE